MGLLQVHIALYQGYPWVTMLNDRILEQGIEGTQANELHTLNPVLCSPVDPSSSGGTKLDAYMGVNYVSNCGVRAALEVGKTLWQDLDGTQLDTDWSLNMGLQFAW